MLLFGANQKRQLAICLIPSLGWRRRMVIWKMGIFNEKLPPALGEVTLLLNENSITDLWMVLTWSSQQ